MQHYCKAVQRAVQRHSSVRPSRRAAVQVQERSMAGAWSGQLTQEEFMLKDQCVLVDDSDTIIGHASKRDSHQFTATNPKGLLHRAFSVFLFDTQGRLLLQQRAHSKVTFPLVWTNTCCSHQLYGQEPAEVDSEADVAEGRVLGAKRAAVRKLEHELGIAQGTISIDQLKYLTRLHYCAADTDKWGPSSPWGEHEIDYILVARADVELNPNKDEVEDVRYVTSAELEQMQHADSGLKWSPWFRIISSTFLKRWWSDLDSTLTSDAHCDFGCIHRVL